MRNAASLVRHRLGDDRGQVLVLATVALLPMLACASLAIDVAGWWTKKTQAHLAADAGALAGAYSLPSGAASGTCPTNPSPTDAVGAACYYALQNYPGATVTVSIPPVSGPSAGDPSKIEVKVSKSEPGIFSALFGIGSVTISARAVGGRPPGIPTGLFAMGSFCSSITITGPAPSGSNFSQVALDTNGGINITGNNYRFGPARYKASCTSPVPNTHNNTFTKLVTHTDTLPWPVDYSPVSNYCNSTSFSDAPSLAGPHSGVLCFSGPLQLSNVSGTVTIVAKCIKSSTNLNLTNVSGKPVLYAYGGQSCAGGKSIDFSSGGTFVGDWFAPGGTIHDSSGTSWSERGLIEGDSIDITSPAANWIATGPGIPGPPTLYE